jgi:hypothetical protein
MRSLTAKQKKILDRAFLEYRPVTQYDLKTADFLQLEDISNHETLLTDIDRYLWDKYSETASFVVNNI